MGEGKAIDPRAPPPLVALPRGPLVAQQPRCRRVECRPARVSYLHPSRAAAQARTSGGRPLPVHATPFGDS